MFVRTATIICDRCKSEVDINPSIVKPFQLGSPKRGDVYDGWAEIDKDKHLCPACHEGYSEIASANAEKLAAYLEGPGA